MDEFGPVIYNLYGSTEMSWATIATPAGPAAGAGGRSAARRRTRASRSSTSTASRLPAGETGRIFVGHELLFEGYTTARAGAS